MKTVFVSIVFAASMTFGALSALGFELLVVNNTDQDVANISVRPGHIEARSTRVPQGTRKSFEITGVSDSQCKAVRLSMNFPDGQSFTDTVNICGGLRFNLGTCEPPFC